jgi:hypothetical protein
MQQLLDHDTAFMPLARAQRKEGSLGLALRGIPFDDFSSVAKHEWRDESEGCHEIIFSFRSAQHWLPDGSAFVVGWCVSCLVSRHDADACAGLTDWSAHLAK